MTAPHAPSASTGSAGGGKQVRPARVVADVLTIYSTTWCGYCMRLKRQLDREDVSYLEVDIERDPSSEALVKSINGGNAVVPTLVFEDGSSLTNPSLKDVLSKLEHAA